MRDRDIDTQILNGLQETAEQNGHSSARDLIEADPETALTSIVDGQFGGDRASAGEYIADILFPESTVDSID